MIENICIMVDAQVVLSWLLCNAPKTKNLIARNRLKDILGMKNRRENDHKKGIKFKYIASSENIADMISRGVDIYQFVNNLEFRQHGPSWQTKGSSFWSSRNLEGLSSEGKDTMG